MPKTVKTVWNIVTWTLVVLVVVFALMLVGVRLIGIQAYTVLSGSMEPTYHVGSLIYVDAAKNDTERAQYKKDDPITFMKDKDTVVTHRIIAVEVVPLTDVEKASGDYKGDTKTLYTTQGDANDVVDGTPVNSKNVIGKPVFSIPFLGYVANYVQSPPGIYVAGAACVVVILLAFLPDILFPEEKAPVAVSGNQQPVTKKEEDDEDDANTSTSPNLLESEDNK